MLKGHLRQSRNGNNPAQSSGNYGMALVVRRGCQILSLQAPRASGDHSATYFRAYFLRALMPLSINTRRRPHG